MTELERWEPESLDALPWWELLPKVAQIVDVVVRTPFVGAGLRGNTAAATAAVMYGHELGLGPMTSLNKLNVIDGSVAPSAELARALAMRAGEVWVEDESDQRVIVAARRHGSDVVHRVEWTIGDARRAGLLNKRNWQTYPKAMLYARATAEIVRRVFPDVLGGITQTAEELGDDRPDDAPERQPVRKAKRAALDPVEAFERRQRRSESQTALEAAVSDEPAEPGPAQPEPEPPAQPPVEPPDPAEMIPPPREHRLTRPTSGGRAPSKAQLDRLRALARSPRIDVGEPSQRAAKLELVGSIVGRIVGSTNELDAEEASRVIDAFVALDESRAHIGTTDDGVLCVVEHES